MTRPQLFRHYLAEQLAMLEHDYAAHIEVAPSQQEIPFPYVIDGSSLALDRSMSAGIAQHFPTTELAQIGDETADGLYHATDNHFPLSHFDALRADFSLARLRHYTGTPVEHFQPFVLFTNYTRYVDEFVRWYAPRSPIRPARTSRSPAPAAPTSRRKPARPSKRCPIWRGKTTRCRPIT